MSHFLAKASLAALLALCTIPVTASAAGPDASLLVQAQYRPVVRACSPIEAVRKARYSGLRDPRITSITPRRVVVSGRDRRGWDKMIFANVRGCPLLRR